MPETYEEGRQLIKQLGLDYDIIDACPCDEFLYYGKKESTLISCPKCNLSRYKANTVTKKVPRKVRLSLSRLVLNNKFYEAHYPEITKYCGTLGNFFIDCCARYIHPCGHILIYLNNFHLFEQNSLLYI